MTHLVPHGPGVTAIRPAKRIAAVSAGSGQLCYRYLGPCGHRTWKRNAWVSAVL